MNADVNAPNAADAPAPSNSLELSTKLVNSPDAPGITPLST